MTARRFALVLVLILIILSPVLSAQVQHVIAYYSFDIIGNTNETLVRKLIAPVTGDPPFADLDSLVKALETKREMLNNLRIFEEVSYTYEVIHSDERALRYRVRFLIDDAMTFLAVPYPKYDSNYGFRLGIKGYDKNAFGTFGDLSFLIDAAQVDGAWDTWNWLAELEVANVPIGRSELYLQGTVTAVKKEQLFEDLFYTGKFFWQDIQLAQTNVDFEFALQSNDEYLSVSDFDQIFTAAFQWENLPWFNSSLKVRPEVQFKREDLESAWNADSVGFSTEVDPIMVNGETYVLSNTLRLQFPHESVQSTTTLNLENAYLAGLPISFWFTADNWFDLDERKLYDNLIETGMGLGFSLPFEIDYFGSYAISIRDQYATALNHVPVVSTNQELSFGKINWKENFRSGLIGAMHGSADYALFSRDFTRLDYLNFIVQGELSTYVSIGKKVGLSMRGLGFYSHIPSFSWYREEQQHFPTFLPDQEGLPSELLRGILDKSFTDIVGESDYQKLGVVANFDATVLFVKFPNFAEGFLNTFMDIGIFSNRVGLGEGTNALSTQDVTIFKTIGLEGYAILNKFPSYPIRASLGLNFDHVMQHFEGSLAFSEIEYELSVGMGLHY